MSIITISRLAGSQGDEIARALAAEFGFQLQGHEAFHALARRHDSDLGEKLERFFRDEGPGFFERLFFSTPAYQSLYEALVFEMASLDKVIIVGRGAQVVLKDVPQALKVRVVAPLENRLLHMCSIHGLTPDEALEFIRRHDQRREALIRQVYAEEPESWKLYDLVINTGRLDVAAGVRLVSDALTELLRVQPQADAREALQAAALGKRVEAKLRSELRSSSDLMVRGEPGGRMVLHGMVPNEHARKSAEQLALKQPGVTGVVNTLRHGVFAYGH